MSAILPAQFDSPPLSGTAHVWWLGQGSFVFKGPRGGPLAVDPYLSNSCGKGGSPGAQRLFPEPVAPADLRLSGLFLTHDHLDHTDPDTLIPLTQANPDIPIYGPPASVAHLAKIGITEERVHTLRRGEAATGEGWTVHAVHAEHTDDSVGLVFVFDNGPTIYHTADTLYFEGIVDAAARFAPDLLCICINGRLGNMNVADAARVTAALRPTEALPMHWGLFAGNTADPQEFADAVAASGAPVRTVILTPGFGRHIAAARGRADA